MKQVNFDLFSTLNGPLVAIVELYNVIVLDSEFIGNTNTEKIRQARKFCSHEFFLSTQE